MHIVAIDLARRRYGTFASKLDLMDQDAYPIFLEETISNGGMPNDHKYSQVVYG